MTSARPRPIFGSRRRVVVADDDDGVRRAVVDLLGDEPLIEVVADAADGAGAIAACLAHRPHVLVVDVNMPRGDGEQVTRELLVQLPALRVIVLSARADRLTRQRMAAAGAAAFVTKGASDNLVALVLDHDRATTG